MTPSRVAIVTGAGSGIGREVARTLSGAGFRVVLAGRRAGTLDAAAKGLTGAREIVTDVRDPASVRGLFNRAVDEFGRVDVLFNNAGLFGDPAPIDELDVERWREVIDTNLTGSFLCAREAFRVMRSQNPQGGRIINNGSLSAHAPRPQAVAYTASKHAITGLTKAIALEGRGYNIACGQLDIGNAATDMTAAIQRGALQADGSTVPEPVFDVRHVAEAVLYMANLPLEANVQTLTVMATQMPYIGRG